MKKFCLFLVSAALFLSCFSISAEEKEHHFYIKRAEDHLPPTTDSAYLSVFGSDGFYLDSAAAEKGEKVLYLTFDAGYENGNIARILDILKEEHVSGAFFVLSHLIKSQPELLLRMKEEGHLICNHTAHHKNMAKMDESSFCTELLALEALYKEQTGNDLAKFYRPPEGTFSTSNLAWAKKIGYKTVFWSLMYKDWNDDVVPEREKAIEILKKNTHPGAIVLLHPTTTRNADILQEMIEYWRAEGYTFGSLDRIG